MAPLQTLARIARNGATCLTPYYRTRPALWSPRLRSLDARVAVSTRRSYACVRIPKAANSTIVKTLLHHFPEPGAERLHPKKAFASPRKLSRAEVRRMEDDFFIFSVVRNPYHRILSAYLDKFEREDPYAKPYLARVRRYGGGELSFPAFCRYLADGGAGENPHWVPQVRLLGLVGIERLDFLGHVENLGPDLQRIVDRIAAAPTPLAIQPTGPAPTEAAEQAAAWYDAECRQIVAGVYREDFEHLGYGPP